MPHDIPDAVDAGADFQRAWAEIHRLREAGRAVVDARQRYVDDRAEEADVDMAIDELAAALKREQP